VPTIPPEIPADQGNVQLVLLAPPTVWAAGTSPPNAACSTPRPAAVSVSVVPPWVAACTARAIRWSYWGQGGSVFTDGLSHKEHRSTHVEGTDLKKRLVEQVRSRRHRALLHSCAPPIEKVP